MNRAIALSVIKLSAFILASAIYGCGGRSSGQAESPPIEPPPAQPPIDEATWLQLDFYKSQCAGRFGYYLCFNTRLESEQHYEPNGCSSNIEDFSFVWGTRYTLLVNFLPDPNDFCGRTRLVKVLESEVLPEGTEFELSVCHWCEEPLVRRQPNGTVELFSELVVQCQTNRLLLGLKSHSPLAEITS